VRNRRTEDRNHRVSDEFLYGSPVAFELALQARVVRVQESGDVLGIHRLGARGETREVDEQRGDHFSLAAWHGPQV